MRIIAIEESRELCSEAGWCAWDITMEKPADEAFILALRTMGSLCCLKRLNPPFFKLEAADRMVKGFLGAEEIRVSMPVEYEDRVKKEITDFIININ